MVQKLLFQNMGYLYFSDIKNKFDLRGNGDMSVIESNMAAIAVLYITS